MPYSVRAILGSSDEVMKKGCICWLVEIPELKNGVIHDIKVVGKSKGGKSISRTMALPDFSRFSASPFEKFSDERIVLPTRAAAKAIADQLEAAQPARDPSCHPGNHDADWIRRDPKSQASPHPGIDAAASINLT